MLVSRMCLVVRQLGGVTINDKKKHTATYLEWYEKYIEDMEMEKKKEKEEHKKEKEKQKKDKDKDQDQDQEKEKDKKEKEPEYGKRIKKGKRRHFS